APPGHRDQAQARPALAQPAGHLEAAQPRQAEVQQDCVGPEGRHLPQRLRAVPRLGGVQNGTGLMEATLAPGVRLFPGSGPIGEAPTATSGPAARPSPLSPRLPAEAPAVTSGLAARSSAVTVLDPAALAPRLPSVVTAVSPSIGGADLATA